LIVRWIMYDAFGRVMEQYTGGTYTQFLYSPSGNLFATMNGSTVQKYFVPLAAGMQAVYTAAPPASVAYYRHSDWLGTNRFASTPSGTVYFDGAYAPFGETYAGLGTSDRVFTSQPMDTVPGLYDFPLREYSNAQGRWLVPDPAGLAAVDITNPQTWNRYAYVANNPLNAIDPLGLYHCIVDGVETDNCPGGGGAGGPGGGGGAPGWPIYGTVDCVGSEGNSGQCYAFLGYTSGFGTGAGAGGAANNGTGFLKKLNTCVVNNAKNYSIGGVANLISNAQIPGSGLASNSITDMYTLLTGQDGLLSSVWSATKAGFQWAAAASPPVMTNGPNSFTTISPAGGSPQAILGNGTNYQGLWTSAKRLLKSGAELKLAVDAGLAGALVLNCSLGQIQ
jgi:RHS repeat-associated protein